MRERVVRERERGRERSRRFFSDRSQPRLPSRHSFVRPSRHLGFADFNFSHNVSATSSHGRKNSYGQHPARQSPAKRNKYFSALEKECTTYFFTNFPDDCGVKELWSFFGKIGSVGDIALPTRRDARGRRFGFVRFKAKDDAARVDCAVQNLCIGSKRLVIHRPRFDRRKNPVTARVGDLKATTSGVHKTAEKHPGSTLKPGTKWSDVVRQGGKGSDSVALMVNNSDLVDCQNIWVADLVEKKDVKDVSDALISHGILSLKVLPLGSSSIAIKGLQGFKPQSLFEPESTWWKELLTKARPWDKSARASERLAWFRCFGLPFHLWSGEVFSQLGNQIGRFMKLSKDTEDWRRLDYGFFLATVKELLPINLCRSFSVNGDTFMVGLSEMVGWPVSDFSLSSQCAICSRSDNSDSTSDFSDDIDLWGDQKELWGSEGEEHVSESIVGPRPILDGKDQAVRGKSSAAGEAVQAECGEEAEVGPVATAMCVGPAVNSGVDYENINGGSGKGVWVKKGLIDGGEDNAHKSHIFYEEGDFCGDSSNFQGEVMKGIKECTANEELVVEETLDAFRVSHFCLGSSKAQDDHKKLYLEGNTNLDFCGPSSPNFQKFDLSFLQDDQDGPVAESTIQNFSELVRTGRGGQVGPAVKPKSVPLGSKHSGGPGFCADWLEKAQHGVHAVQELGRGLGIHNTVGGPGLHVDEKDGREGLGLDGGQKLCR